MCMILAHTSISTPLLPISQILFWWNGIQNLHRDIQLLASYLTRELKRFASEKVIPIEGTKTQ